MERSFRKTGQGLCLLTLLSVIRSAGSEDVSEHGIKDSVTISAGINIDLQQEKEK